MEIAQILKNKGGGIVTTRPDATIGEAVELLGRERIGALIVKNDAGGVAGILSERDIVRALPAHRGDILDMKVGDFMTREVITCAPEDRVEDIMRDMTEGRFRHLPVVRNGRLIGIVSIGDAVKSRLQELETETGHLRDYISGQG